MGVLWVLNVSFSHCVDEFVSYLKAELGLGSLFQAIGTDKSKLGLVFIRWISPTFLSANVWLIPKLVSAVYAMLKKPHM